MSQQLINRSPDLKRLRDEGYEIEVCQGGYLVVHAVPYLDHSRQLRIGTLVSELTLAGDITTKPGSHTVYYSGEYPCDRDGSPIPQIRNSSKRKTLTPGLDVDHMFSNKPKGGYKDYHEKITTYVKIITHPAISLFPHANPCTFKLIESDESSVFEYIDTASSRAGIGAVSDKLSGKKIGIVGLGGTGSYILDLVAKMAVGEIHLFDGDVFQQHNAFRSPGAASLASLQTHAPKVDYFQKLYSELHRNVVPHAFFVDESNVETLKGLDFVFLCLDNNQARKQIATKLEEFGISFIDVGLGVNLIDDTLIGQIRVTTSTSSTREPARSRMPMSDLNVDNDYVSNIQVCELNALNASFAVMKWKKLEGFYQDLETEYNMVYAVNVNQLVNETSS